MLKFILMLLSLAFMVKGWSVIQIGALVVMFILSVAQVSMFSMSQLGWGLGSDYLSMILIMLSIWIISLIFISSIKITFFSNFEDSFLLSNMSLLFFLVLTFSSMDYLLFYITFEISLIPTLILILGWGYQPERTQAGIYMLFYTLFGSLPLLVSLLYIYKVTGSLNISVFNEMKILSSLSLLWFFCTIIAFVVKLPMYLFHVWLPKAHVEAPVAGSMILAGVLLKLGGYGLIRAFPLFKEISCSVSWFWIGLSMLGSVFVSILCLREIDMKSLIAYSSVAHMGMVLGGLMTMNLSGLNGAVIVMLGHGLCSSGLFCLANMVYERVGSRSLLINKGLMIFMPSMALWWFLLSIGNMGAPPSINLLGEISLIISMVSWSKVTIWSISLLSFFCVAYTLYLYSLSQHGTYSNCVYSCVSGTVREFLVLSLHWIPLNFLILKSNFIIYG